MPFRTPPLLLMNDIHVRYNDCLALKGVDFELYHGEIHGLVGEHRAGKAADVRFETGQTFGDGMRFFRETLELQHDLFHRRGGPTPESGERLEAAFFGNKISPYDIEVLHEPGNLFFQIVVPEPVRLGPGNHNNAPVSVVQSIYRIFNGSERLGDRT